MTKLSDALTGVRSLGFDASSVIYFVEAHPQYDSLVTRAFQLVTDGLLRGVTSVITLTEVLTQPMRRGSADLEREYRGLLPYSDYFETLNVDPHVAECAADIRARYNLRTPDALQVATAITAGCEAFLTNDPVMQKVNELRVLVLDELEI